MISETIAEMSYLWRAGKHEGVTHHMEGEAYACTARLLCARRATDPALPLRRWCHIFRENGEQLPR